MKNRIKRLKRWLRIKKLGKLQGTPYTWTFANHVEWSRLTNSRTTIKNAERVMGSEKAEMEIKCYKCQKTLTFVVYDITSNYACHSCITNILNPGHADKKRPQLKIIQGGKK